MQSIILFQISANAAKKILALHTAKEGFRDFMFCLAKIQNYTKVIGV